MGNRMKSATLLVLLGATSTVLTGCGSTMRNYLEKDTPTQSAAVRSDLTMPPDLRLPQPGTTAAGTRSRHVQFAGLACRTSACCGSTRSPRSTTLRGNNGCRQHLHTGGHFPLQG